MDLLLIATYIGTASAIWQWCITRELFCFLVSVVHDSFSALEYPLTWKASFKCLISPVGCSVSQMRVTRYAKVIRFCNGLWLKYLWR